MKTPSWFDNWNPAMRGAYRKGYEVGATGLGPDACPYKDKRKDCGGLTWSRAFQSCWRDGWDAGRQDNPITAYYSDRARSRVAARRP